jgi:hypothetical protein
LAKQLHPDKGGNATDFQRMQDEYKTLLLRLLQQQDRQKEPVRSAQQLPPENELLGELGKLAQEFIIQQVPQNFLKQKIQVTDSILKKKLFSGIIDFLDEL